MQVTSALVAVRHHLQGGRGGELDRNGVLDIHPVHDAAVRHPVHRLFPVEDEQESRFHYVPALLCLRCGLAHVRIRGHDMPGVNVYRTHNITDKHI